jgi:hypothetical protein
MRKLRSAFLCFYLLSSGITFANAQGTARLDLFDLQTAAFPTMTAGLDVFDSSGNFLTGLRPDAVTLLEDKQPRSLNSLKELQPGTEFALALDPGPHFAYRDSNAITRFTKLLNALGEWTAAHPDSLDDDLSLIPTGGKLATHLAKTSAFSDALSAYQPNLQSLVSNPETLSLALDAVSEPSSTVGRKPVVLYITSIAEAADIPVLQNLTQRAVSENIRVNVWIVVSQDFFSTSGATALKDLAIQTGGQYFLFSGRESLPSPEVYLAPLRHSYRLEYSSAILSPGGHTLSAQISLEGGTVASAEISFDLDVQPPNPILVAPPEQIVRQAPDERTTKVSLFLPTQQSISIVVEFPDRRARPLVRTALYVDGILAAENKIAPFDQFNWDLSAYTTSGQHLLTVEAVDALGLSKISLGIPVTVTIVRPAVGLLPWLARNRTWVALGAILLTGGGLAAILTRGRSSRRRPAGTGRRVPHDPLTQSIHTGRGKRGIRIPRKGQAKLTDAYLVRLKEDDQPITAPPIPISVAEMIFGSDPIQVTHILDDPSVSPVHARITEDHGGYILSDENSTSGTWVNFERVTTPRRLQHGDLLHMGQVSYRFMLYTPPERRKLQVIPTKK